MANQFYGDETFGFEVIASGSFEDAHHHVVTARIIRLNKTAMRSYYAKDYDDYDQRVATRNKVLAMLGVDADQYCHVRQIITEVFAVLTREQIIDNAVG